MPDGEIAFPGCLVHCVDCSRCDGGVAVFYADHLHCSVLSSGISSSDIESLWLSVKSKFLSSSLTLSSFYRAPSSPSLLITDLCTNLESMMISQKYVVACGDFNINMGDLSKPQS